VIGKGAFGSVSIVYERNTGNKSAYAAKTFRKRSNISVEKHEKAIRAEFNIARRLRHPNILKTIALCSHEQSLACVMDYCRQGDLFTMIELGYLTLDERMCLFKQLLEGISYLHSQGIAHRDIKPDNLLLSDTSVLKVADFGCATVFKTPSMGPGQIRMCPAEICGTDVYLPPEVWHDIKYDPRPLDVWASALVGRELIGLGPRWEIATSSCEEYKWFGTGWLNFKKDHPDGIIDDNQYPFCGTGFEYPDYPKHQLRVLILKMLNPSPSQRITIDAALQDPFVQRIECCSS
ncbi:kinase-like protein, partial [Aspergillus ellipticus CBS 707.79]